MAIVTGPRPTTGLTATSVQSFLVDSGAVYLNFGETDERVLGATRGGNVFTVEQDIRLVEIDGIKGATKGARRVIESNARITARLMELTSANLLIALPATTSTVTNEAGITGTTHNMLRRTREIISADYYKNIAIVGKVAGTTKNFVGIIYNPLADGGFTIEQIDRDESVVEIQFTAHYDVATITTEPWAILTPVIP
jgi:hypothetical protein